MSDKIYKSDRTKFFIIERMAEVFNKQGYAGTSMADVQAITGLSRGGIYGNFENKEVMALAVFDYNLSRLCTVIRDLITKEDSYHQKLMVYAKVYKLLSEDGFVLGGSPILNTAAEADDTNPLLKAKAGNASQKWQGCMIHFLNSGIEAGEFRTDIDVNQVSFTILSLIEGGLALSRLQNDPSRMEQIMKSVEAIINGFEEKK